MSLGDGPEEGSGRPTAAVAMNDVTRILSAIEQGDPKAAGALMPLVYDELRKLAAQKLAQEKPGQTLQATALVHEAYLRLVDTEKVQRWESRGHFFAAAVEAMRRILVENARRKRRQKRGGGLARVDLENAEAACRMPPADLLALDEALAKLAAEDPMKARLVELRFFAGLNLEEASKAIGVSAITAKRYWRYARAWLHREVAGGNDPGDALAGGQEFFRLG
jgi:RNA polymerase sigma factor (TIGR02999 family)